MRVGCWRFAAWMLLLAVVVTGPVAGQHDDESEGADAAHGETQVDDPAAHVHEEIVVTGTRARQRSVTESMAPVDVDPGRAGGAPGGDEPGHAAAERGAFVQHQRDLRRRRRHRPADEPAGPGAGPHAGAGERQASAPGAVILWSRIGVSHGAQGPDLSAIPAIALRQVEVLRDGAAAQYGSDAIAGVMNFLLKDARSGGALEVMTGAYGAGDGESVTLAGNLGLPWGEAGFVNLSLEVGGARPTNRNIQRADAKVLIAAGNTHVADPAQEWGAPEVEDDVKLWANFGRPLTGGAQFYGHANYASRRIGSRNFFFRNPNTRQAVFSNDGGRTLLIGDVIDAADGVADGSAGLPTGCGEQRAAGAGGVGPGSRRPELLQFPGDLPGRLSADLRWRTGRRVAGRRRAWRYLRRHDLGRQRQRRSERDRLLPGRQRQRVAGAAVADLVRARSLRPAGCERELRPGPADERAAASGRGSGVAQRELRDRSGRSRFLAESDRTRGRGSVPGSNGFPGFSPIAVGRWDRANAAVYGDLEYGPPDHSWSRGRGAPLRGVRGLRLDGERQARRARGGGARAGDQGKREHRLPGADAGSAERVQRVDPMGFGNDGACQQRDDPAVVPGRGAAGRQGAAAGEVAQPRRRSRSGAGAVSR